MSRTNTFCHTLCVNLHTTIMYHYSMGKRKLSFDVGKNGGRKKYLKLNIHIPLELIKPFIVSLPLCNYTHAPIDNGESLCKASTMPVTYTLVTCKN